MRRTALMACLWTALAAPALRAEPPATEEIARAVRQLGDDEYATRERATAWLWSVGAPAVPALVQAAASKDAEVAARARDLLNKIPYGLTPDSPRRYAELIARARTGPGAWPAVVGELLDLGPPGLDLARKLADGQTNPAQQEQFRLLIDREGWRLVPRLLADGDAATAEGLLERAAVRWALSAGDPAAVRHYAAYVAVAGKLDEQIPRWQARTSGAPGKDAAVAPAPGARPLVPDPKASAVILAYLARAKGDATLARQAAEQTGRPDLIEAALFDAGAWADLATRPVTNVRHALIPVGLRAMYQERAGRTAEAAAVRKELAGLAEAAPGNYQTTWIVFRALMFADRPADAVKVLEGTADHAGVVARFEVMCQQGRYAEALAFIEGRMPGAGPYRLSWNVTRARALAQVGDTAKLRDVLAALKQEHVDPDVETNWPDLIEQVTAVGLRDALADQVATLLSSDPPVPRAGPAELFAKLYPKAPLATETWWRHFRRQNPGESPRATLDRLPALCDARLAEPAGKAALEAATAAARALPPAEGERWLRGLGEACLAAGMVEPARKHFEEATRRGDTPEAWQRLGEVLAEQGHWADAEAAFDKAWQKDRKQPLPLFQRCWAKIQRGGAAAAEGRRDLALAHLLPLGNELDRGAFVEELAKRSADPGDEFAEAARQERRLVVQAAMLFSIPGRNAQRQLAGDPRAFADRSQVVDATERLLLRMLRTDTYYYRAEGYLAALTRLHAERARSLLAKGDAGGALREAVAAQELVPTQATVAQQLVPEFEKAGHKELADRLYAAAAAGQDKLLADHPNSAVFRNNRAWLAATCNRDLEAALAHARKAVELLPDNPGHLDTLAEVHFRRGETGQAVERMKQCLSVDPRNAYYARQLKRFEAGDRSAPVPER